VSRQRSRWLCTLSGQLWRDGMTHRWRYLLGPVSSEDMQTPSEVVRFLWKMRNVLKRVKNQFFLVVSENSSKIDLENSTKLTFRIFHVNLTTIDFIFWVMVILVLKIWSIFDEFWIKMLIPISFYSTHSAFFIKIWPFLKEGRGLHILSREKAFLICLGKQGIS